MKHTNPSLTKMANFPGVPGYTRVVSITIPSTRNGGQERSALMSVSNNNIEEEFLMFKGKWTVTVTCDSQYLLMVSEFEMWLVYLNFILDTDHLLNFGRSRRRMGFHSSNFSLYPL